MSGTPKHESGGALMRVLALLVLSVAFALPLGIAGQGAAGCGPVGNVQFVCGQDAPEDLVALPGSEWVVASVFSGKGGIRLINVRDKTTTVAYPTAASRDRLDA